MRRSTHRTLAPVLLAALGACTVIPGDGAKQDTTVAAAAPVSASQLPGAGDTLRPGGVPAVPGDSAALAAQQPDSGVLEMYPPQPRRGGVLFAFARGLVTPTPRCTWKGAPLPCYAVNGGVLATVPLPADEAVGTFPLVVERPGGRIERQVAVAEREFDRAVILLTPELYARVRRSADVARDARALRTVLATESAERRWTGRWKEALPGATSGGYGVERFYYAASDSARAITLKAAQRTRGSFGADTSQLAKGDTPGWRHAGIDITARRGAAVVAPAAGVVVDVGEYVLSGRTVIVDHGQGTMTAYFHLDTALVRRGDPVRQGRTIGRVGATGLATGPHLHYGVYVHGRDVDPAAWRDMPEWVVGGPAAATAGRR